LLGVSRLESPGVLMAVRHAEAIEARAVRASARAVFASTNTRWRCRSAS